MTIEDVGGEMSDKLLAMMLFALAWPVAVLVHIVVERVKRRQRDDG